MKHMVWAAQVLGAMVTIGGGLFLGLGGVRMASFAGDSPNAGAAPYLFLALGLIVPAFLVYFGARVLVMLVRTRGPTE